MATGSHGSHGPSPTAPARRAHGGVANRDDAGVVVNGVSSDDEPSVEWGWHGHYPKVARFAGFVVAAVLVVLIIGNHTGKTEDIWLLVLAVGFFSLSVGAIVRARTSWRR